MTEVRHTAPVVALDIGNVCVRLHPDECARNLGFESEQDVYGHHPEILDRITAFESGRTTSEDFFRYLRKIARSGLTLSQIKDAWLSLIGDEVQNIGQAIDVMKDAGLSVVFLSNISSVHYIYVQSRLSFMNKIDGATLSYEVGQVKPGHAIYTAFEAAHCNDGVPAVFLDDKLENIEAAVGHGWSSHQVLDSDAILELVHRII